MWSGDTKNTQGHILRLLGALALSLFTHPITHQNFCASEMIQAGKPPLSVILCENWSFVQKIIKIQHFAVNYGRIVVIDFRNAKTLPLRKCFTRLCGDFVYFQVSEVGMLWKVMLKCRFLRIQIMGFIKIVHLSCKCNFSKTHLQYDARIHF